MFSFFNYKCQTQKVFITTILCIIGYPNLYKSSKSLSCPITARFASMNSVQVNIPSPLRSKASKSSWVGQSIVSNPQN